VETHFTVNLLRTVPEEVRGTVALQLAEKFNVSIAKMNRLLASARGPITKPIMQGDAEKIARVLGQAGIEVAVVRSDLDKVLLIPEEPIITRQDRYELRELLADLPESLPVASRLSEPALAEKPDRSVPASKSPLGRPMIVTILSLLALVLTVAFGVRIMSPERPLLPTQPSLSTFEQGMVASTSGDYENALELWTTLADPSDGSEGNVNAQFELAWLYTNGLGTSKDLEKAASYFNKAAEGGHVEAQNKLGHLYLYGQGVTQDRTTAIKWLTAAAEGGWGDAQLTLGKLYLTGEGTEVNLAEADTWLNLAAKQGVKGSDEALGELMRLQAVSKVGSSGADMFAAVEKNDPQAVIGAVLAGTDINRQSQDGYTPLMYAVTKGNPEVVKEVLSGGADINVQSSTGWTALMFAAKDAPQTLEVLLAGKPDLSLKNNVGQSAYDIALKFQPDSAAMLAQ
jgi:Ankyrin repeats (3 copies)/Sel1 repeat